MNKVNRALFVITMFMLISAMQFTSGYTYSRGIEDGDTVEMSYVFSYDGEIQQTVDSFQTLVSSAQLIQGFYEGLLGMKLNENRTIIVPPDKGYTDPNSQLYGKTLYFDVYIKVIIQNVRNNDIEIVINGDMSDWNNITIALIANESEYNVSEEFPSPEIDWIQIANDETNLYFRISYETPWDHPMAFTNVTLQNLAEDVFVIMAWSDISSSNVLVVPGRTIDEPWNHPTNPIVAEYDGYAKDGLNFTSLEFKVPMQAVNSGNSSNLEVIEMTFWNIDDDKAGFLVYEPRIGSIGDQYPPFVAPPETDDFTDSDNFTDYSTVDDILTNGTFIEISLPFNLGFEYAIMLSLSSLMILVVFKRKTGIGNN